VKEKKEKEKKEKEKGSVNKPQTMLSYNNRGQGNNTKMFFFFFKVSERSLGFEGR